MGKGLGAEPHTSPAPWAASWAWLTLAFLGPPVPAVQRIAESHLQSISNLNENQASEEEDELGELRELGYPREDEEDYDDEEEEEEEEDSQAEVLKGSRGFGKLKGLCSLGPSAMGWMGSSLSVPGHPPTQLTVSQELQSLKGLPFSSSIGCLTLTLPDTCAAPI